MSDPTQQQQAPGTTNPPAQAPHPPPAGAPPAGYHPPGQYPPPGAPPTGYYPPPPGQYPYPPPPGQYPPPPSGAHPGSQPLATGTQPPTAATSAPGQQPPTPAAVPPGQQAPPTGAPQGYPAYPGYAPWPGYPPSGGYPGYPPPPGPPGQQQPYYGYAPPYGVPPQGYGQPPAPYGAYPVPPAQPQAPGTPQPSGSPQPPQPGQLPPASPYPMYGQPPAAVPGYPALAPPMPDYGASSTLSRKETWYLGTKIPDPDAPAAALGVQKVPNFEPDVEYDRLIAQRKRYANSWPGISEITFVKFVLEMPLLSRDALNDYCIAKHGQDLYGILQDPSPRTCISSMHVTTIVKALIQGPLKFDIELLKGGLSGIGANEMVLTEILLNRSYDDIVLLNKAYTQNYGRTLIQHIATQSDISLSPELKRLFTMALNNQRDRSFVVDHAAVESDVQALISGRKGKEDHERSKFIEIFVNRSQPHLAAVITSFGQRSKSLSSVIKSSKYFPNDFKAALLFILHGVKPKRDGQGIWRDAKLLEKTMAGMGTRDTALVYRLIRAHWDPTRFAAVKEAYFNHYHKGLEKRVSGETSGTYREALLLLVRSNDMKSDAAPTTSSSG